MTFKIQKYQDRKINKQLGIVLHQQTSVSEKNDAKKRQIDSKSVTDPIKENLNLTFEMIAACKPTSF